MLIRQGYSYKAALATVTAEAAEAVTAEAAGSSPVPVVPNNAGELLREALRRMEDENERALRVAKPTAEDILTDLSEEQLDGIRRRVSSANETIEAGSFVDFDGREGLKKLADGVKARGRKLLTLIICVPAEGRQFEFENDGFTDCSNSERDGSLDRCRDINHSAQNRKSGLNHI